MTNHHRKLFPGGLLLPIFLGCLCALLLFPPNNIAACRNMIQLTEADGSSIEFTTIQIAAVFPNHGEYPSQVHAVISTSDSHEYGVRETVPEIERILQDGVCQK